MRPSNYPNKDSQRNSKARKYAVGDVITIDHQDGPSAPDPGGKAEINGGYLWFYDSQYFKRQPAFSWGGPGTGGPAIGRVTDLPSATSTPEMLSRCGDRRRR